MPELKITHPYYTPNRGLLENGWYVTAEYPDGSHCDIEQFGFEDEPDEIIGGALLEGEYDYDYIYAHYRPYIEIGEVE